MLHFPSVLHLTIFFGNKLDKEPKFGIHILCVAFYQCTKNQEFDIFEITAF